MLWKGQICRTNASFDCMDVLNMKGTTIKKTKKILQKLTFANREVEDVGMPEQWRSGRGNEICKTQLLSNERF